MNKTESKNKIKWINEAKGEDGDCAYWVSTGGRFDIQPLFNHGTKPWSYDLHDRTLKTKRHTYGVRSAKQMAQEIVDKEAASKALDPATELRFAVESRNRWSALATHLENKVNTAQQGLEAIANAGLGFSYEGFTGQQALQKLAMVTLRKLAEEAK
jgi:hypothetical protein